MFVKENKLKGIFSDKKLAEEVSSRRAKTIRNVLKKGDVYDQDRIFGKHNVYSTDGSNEWDLHLFKLRVPTSQLEEKNGVIYWKRPLVKFLDYDQPVGDISTLWVLEDIENEPARKIQVNKTLRSRILKI